MSRIIDDLVDQIELLGFTPGTPEFDRELRKEQVNRCMEIQEVPSCTECARFTYCNLRLAYWRDIALGPEHVNEVDAKHVEGSEEDLPEEG